MHDWRRRLYLNTLDCRRDLVRHFEQQWQLTDRNSKNVPVRYHAYVKTMDGTQALSPENYRARLEVTLQGEALPFTTLEQLNARHLRELMINATEHLQATSLKEAVLVMRAAAAYSTAIKNTLDMMRHTLRIEKTIDDTDKELPELVIKELTSEEIEEMRRKGVEEEEALA